MRNPRRRETATGPLWAELQEQAMRMRRQATPAEARLWQELRSGKLDGLKFRRQHALERFIVDFYCVRAALVIEVDGPVHEAQRESDEERQAYLEAIGLTVLRFTNDEVMTETASVLDSIRVTAQRLSTSSPSPQEGEGAGGEVVPRDSARCHREFC